MKNLIYLSLFMLCSGCFGPKVDPQSPEALVYNLVDALADKKYQTYFNLLPTPEEVQYGLEMNGRKVNEESFARRVRNMMEERPKLYQQFYEKRKNWEDVNIESINYIIREEKKLKTCDITVYFEANNKSCELILYQCIKVGEGTWKFTSIPEFKPCQ